MEAKLRKLTYKFNYSLDNVKACKAINKLNNLQANLTVPIAFNDNILGRFQEHSPGGVL